MKVIWDLKTETKNPSHIVHSALYIHVMHYNNILQFVGLKVKRILIPSMLSTFSVECELLVSVSEFSDIFFPDSFLNILFNCKKITFCQIDFQLPSPNLLWNSNKSKEIAFKNTRQLLANQLYLSNNRILGLSRCPLRSLASYSCGFTLGGKHIQGSLSKLPLSMIKEAKSLHPDY